MANYLLYATLLLVAGTTSAVAQSVTAEYSTVKLPKPASYSTAMYVRNDTIYIFGGYNGDTNTKTVLLYNTVTDTIEEVAQIPSMGENGSLQRYNRSIYYFAGFVKEDPAQYTRVIKFDPATNAVTEEGRLPTSTYYHTSFKDGVASVGYFLYAQRDWSMLSSYDLNTKNFSDVKNVGEFFGRNSVLLGNNAYVFGTNIPTFDGQVLKVDLTSFDHQLISPRAPYNSGNLVTDGISAYAFGCPDPAGDSFSEVLKFDLTTHGWEILEVENLLTTEDEYFSIPPTSVYAENQNRIYYFGGQTRKRDTQVARDRDEIWYIDLNQGSRKV